MNQLLARLMDLSPEAAVIFYQQWQEARGSWERDSWYDRIQAHIKFLESHEFDGLRWHLKTTPSTAPD